MASTYTSTELIGKGVALKENFTAATTYTITTSNNTTQGDSYLIMETVPNPYPSALPLYFEGSEWSGSGVNGQVYDGYTQGINIFPAEDAEIFWTPGVNVTGANVYIKSTGVFNVSIAGGGASPVDTGTEVAFTAGTLFDAYSSRDGITSTDAFSTNNGAWQLYYAHDNITISAGANTIGLNPYQNGTNTWTWYYAVASTTNSTGSWGSVGTLAPARSGAYTGGTLTYSSISSNVNVPANTYFLIANSGGPFYRTIKSLAANRTAMVGGSPYITAINKVALGNWPSGGTTTIPTQFGGAGTGYTFYDGYAHVHSVTFA